MILLIPVFLKIALKVNFDRLLRLRIEPYFAAGEPVVGQLGLPAFFELLLENAVLIADRMTGCGIARGCKAVEIAGSQSAQTAVAQSRIRLKS